MTVPGLGGRSADAVPAAPTRGLGVASADAEVLRRDATAKAALYARLSRSAAARRDAAVATAAAWAADVFAVQALLWERTPDAGSAGYQRFLAVGGAIRDTLGRVGSPGRDAREVVVAARRAMLAAFDAPAAALISGRLADLEHLAELPIPGAVGARPGLLGARIADQPAAAFAAAVPSAAALAADLQRTAGDCRTVAVALADAGFGRDATQQAFLGEIAAAEAYLLQASLVAGDSGVLAAELRRAALAEVLPAPADLPADMAAMRSAVRQALRAVLAPAELARLAASAEGAPTASPDAASTTSVDRSPADAAQPAPVDPGRTIPADAGPADAGPADAGPADAGAADAGAADADDSELPPPTRGSA